MRLPIERQLNAPAFGTAFSPVRPAEPCTRHRSLRKAPEQSRAFNDIHQNLTLAIADENQDVALSVYDQRPLAGLVEEFEQVRRSNVLYVEHLPEDALQRMGTVGKNPGSVRAALWIMDGHVRRHLTVVRQSYGVAPGV
jgi:hypothetical protein